MKSIGFTGNELVGGNVKEKSYVGKRNALEAFVRHFAKSVGQLRPFVSIMITRQGVFVVGSVTPAIGR